MRLVYWILLPALVRFSELGAATYLMQVADNLLPQMISLPVFFTDNMEGHPSAAALPMRQVRVIDDIMPVANGTNLQTSFQNIFNKRNDISGIHHIRQGSPQTCKPDY